MKTGIIFLILSIICSTTLFGQNLIIINKDTTEVYSDSVVLKSDNPYENIKWEYLSEGEWIPFDYNNTDSTFVLLDSSTYLRSISFDPDCQQRISDTVIIETLQPFIVDGSTFNCDQKGGYFQLFDTIFMKVPDFAVETPSNLDFTIYTSYDENTFGYITENPDRLFLFGFEFQGDNPATKRSKLRIKTSIIPSDHILQIFLYDEMNQKWNFPDTYLLFSSKKEYLKTEISYGKYAIFAMPLMPDQTNNSRISDEDVCKSGDIYVEEGGIDNSIDDCQVIVNETKVVFIDCGNTTGGVIEQHIGNTCIPEVYYDIEQDAIKVNQTTIISFEVQIAGYPLKDQVISIQVPESVTIDNNSKRTNDQGKVFFTITGAAEALPATIDYTAFIHYYLSSQLAYDEIQGKAFNTGELIQQTFTGSLLLNVISECTKPEDINCSILLKPELCEPIKDVLTTHIDVLPNPIEVKEGSSVTALVTALNRNLVSVAPPTYYLRPDDPRIASGHKISDEEFTVVGINEGQTILHLLWCDNDESINVSVLEETDCDKAVVNVYPGSLTLIEGAKYRLKVSYGEDPVYIPVLSFNSSNPQYASVDDNGLVTAHQVGNTVVTVSWCDDFYSIDIPVEVVDACTATNVIISPQNLVIEKKEHYPLDIEYEFINDTSLFIPLITWESNNEAIATVSDLGVVYGVDVGNTSIEATWCDSEKTIISVEVVEASCDTDPFQSKCTGYLKSYLMSTEFHTSSSGGTFYFDYYLDYRVVYAIADGIIAEKYVELGGEYYYNWWGWTYLDEKCQFNDEECIPHIKFELLEEDFINLKGKVKIICTYNEGLEEENSYPLVWYWYDL